MDEMLKKEISDLKNKVSILESFMKKKEQKQLTYPLDINSFDIVREGLLSFSEQVAGTVTADKTLRVAINGKLYKINAL